jgi:hypothetical protein
LYHLGIIYNDNISAVTYENVNLGNPTSNLTELIQDRYDERNNRIDAHVGVFLGSVQALKAYQLQTKKFQFRV